MTPKSIEVTIAGFRVRVPVHRDEKATQALAAAVSERFKSIEAQSTKINTQAFAIQTAYSFALELTQLREGTNAEDQDLIKALDKIESAIQATLAELTTSPD